MQITPVLILSCSALLLVFADAQILPWDPGEGAETESIGCCSPVIVRTSSVIQAVPGSSGNVTIVVDWGLDYQGGRACTTSDIGFTYICSYKS